MSSCASSKVPIVDSRKLRIGRDAAEPSYPRKQVSRLIGAKTNLDSPACAGMTSRVELCH
jgi:hypothetical protein